MKTVAWAMVLLAIIVYVFSIVLTQAATDYVLAMEITEAVYDLDMMEELLYHFGSVPDSMLSLFMAVSGGVSWIDFIRILRPISEAWMLVLVLFVIITEFAVLNVVTGLFCQSAIESVSSDQEMMIQSFQSNKQLYVERFADLFGKLDTAGHGYISKQDFVAGMYDEDVVAYFAALELECVDALALFTMFHYDQKKGIPLEDFVMGCLRLKGGAKSCDMLKLMHESREQLRILQRLARWAGSVEWTKSLSATSEPQEVTVEI